MTAADEAMKKIKLNFFAGAMALFPAFAGWGATADFYVNDSIVQVPPDLPPQVDATNFVNNNLFVINNTNVVQLYKTANTLNYTNTGLIIGTDGFQFDYGPSGFGQRRQALSFDNRGVISAGSISNFYPGGNVIAAPPQLHIAATNITMNSASNIVGSFGLLGITGRNLDFYRTMMEIEGSGTSAGISDGYWGVGSTNFTPTISPVAQFEFPPPRSGFHPVTLPGNIQGFASLALPGAVSYVDQFLDFTGTNRFVQVVFVRNANTNFTNNVNLNLGTFGGTITVELAARFLDPRTGQPTTNYVYVSDRFNRGQNQIPLFGTVMPTGLATFQPGNYTITVGGPQVITPLATPGSTTDVFDPVSVTNQFSAYQAVFSAATILPSQLAQPILSNLPGRVEITAAGSLNLNRTRISGPNYMRLNATNHFAGSEGSIIGAAYSDIYFGSTNGVLNITNLFTPSLPMFSGVINLWSGRWTNDFNRPQNGPTRTVYHVLLVDNQLNPTSAALVQDFILRSTNKFGGPDSIMISDVINVTRTLMLESQRITITTNPASVTGTRGEINIQSAAITWPTSTPRLQYLTNNGAISSSNSVFFGGSRSSPFYTSNFNEPYIAFVNRGPVSTEGNLIWANYFENSGTFNCGNGFGSVALQSQIAHLTNGGFISPRGDVSITTSELIVTNHALSAGRTLTLTVNNYLTDTGVSNANTWAAGRGVQLLAQPNNGDLLGTTIVDTLGNGVEGLHKWAGQDRSCSTDGFLNNAALGKLIMDGGVDSLFRFAPVGASSALYVDCIEFRDHTTTTIINGFGQVEGVQIDPGMKIYYAQALATDGSVAERINGANNGQFCWVSSYAGIYSSTNLIYQDGSTNTFNAALVQSCNLDSDGDGLVNCIDPEPILTSQTLALSVAPESAPTKGARLSWQSTPGSVNYVYYRTAHGAAWQPLTNFVNPNPSFGRVSAFDPMATNATRYYRVRVDATQP